MKKTKTNMESIYNGYLFLFTLTVMLLILAKLVIWPVNHIIRFFAAIFLLGLSLAFINLVDRMLQEGYVRRKGKTLWIQAVAILALAGILLFPVPVILKSVLTGLDLVILLTTKKPQRRKEEKKNEEA